jgi:hypothetical protein
LNAGHKTPAVAGLATVTTDGLALRATNAELRPREYLVPAEVEKLPRPLGMVVMVTATPLLILPFGIVIWNGQKSSSVARRHCMCGVPRTGRRVFTCSAVTSC